MRALRLFVAAFAFLLASTLVLTPESPALRQPRADAQPIDVSVEWGPFYGELSPWGRWFYYSPYGWVWTPTVVSPSWRPYTVGRWVWTDAGWAWQSDEPFGWITMHYGRWVYDGEFGWLWVPDTQWGPAWVCWRESGLFYGWAPLPPGWIYGAGFGTCSPWIGAWVFVDVNDFLAPDLSYYCVPPARNTWVYRNTAPLLTTTTFHEPPGTPGARTVVVPRGPARARVAARAPVGTIPSTTVSRIRGEHPVPQFRNARPPTRVPRQPGARNLGEPPIAGQHRPEVVRPLPPRAPAIPPADRGPRVPRAPQPRAAPPPPSSAPQRAPATPPASSSHEAPPRTPKKPIHR